MKIYIRNEKNEIIGFKEVLEENERLNKIIELENQAKKYKMKQIASLNEKKKDIRNMLFRFYSHKYLSIMLEIDKLYNTPTYKYEEMFNFNVQPERLECTSFVPKDKKEKIKSLNNTYKIIREGNKRKDTSIITLDSEYYK